ncbi:uncharacterized protein YqhQ [Paraburkholderia youngii]
MARAGHRGSSFTRVIASREEREMEQSETETTAESERKRLVRSKIHVGLAAVGTLSSVFGIGIAIIGGINFDRTKVLVGVGIIVVSTILYVSMLFVAADD